MSYKSEMERVAAEKAAKEAPTPVPTPVKSTAEVEIERLKKENEELKKKSEEAAKTANAEVERLKKELNEKRRSAEPEKAVDKKEDSKKSDKKGDGKMSETEKTAKMVAPMGYAAKTRALLDCMYATCQQFEQEVAELETLEGILSASEDELGDALHVWKYKDRNGIPAFARTMGEVLKKSPGGKPEETWAFFVRGEFLELTREQKEMFGLT